TCDCADLYLGDYAGQTINLSTGIGDVSQALDICDFGLGDDIARVLSGEITINHDAYITVLVDGSVCGGYTSWNLNIDCSGNNSLNKLSEVELESFAQKEIQFNIDFDFNIYPNPASNEVVVQISDNHIPVDVSIKDITGKTTFIKNNIQVAEYRIDVQTMPQGIYFVHVKGRNQELVKKLMIE
ncbi:MAG: T9SS type A sorting domain-containing protein, partial [Saprospiraceae bacterium]|nr:T9SS type A sorting domain-containing protein [Saprospiraceae bacterium]